MQEFVRLPGIEVVHADAIICRKRLTAFDFAGTLSPQHKRTARHSMSAQRVLAPI
jgi:hypothetical protein